MYRKLHSKGYGCHGCGERQNLAEKIPEGGGRTAEAKEEKLSRNSDTVFEKKRTDVEVAKKL